MALPDIVPTKISSEAAGYVNITPVAQREMPLAELVEQILGVTGKDVRRIREVLSRGSFVAGLSGSSKSLVMSPGGTWLARVWMT